MTKLQDNSPDWLGIVIMVCVTAVCITALYVISQHATGRDTRVIHVQPVWQAIEGEQQCVSTAGNVARQWPDEACK